MPGPVTKCEGGPFTRASDPWVDFSPNGTAYFMHLAFEPDQPNGGFGDNAMLVTRSTDGGLSWGGPITLRSDTNPQVLNDKNSLRADPTNANFAYAVWDRLIDFTLPPGQRGRGGGRRGRRRGEGARTGTAAPRRGERRHRATADRGLLHRPRLVRPDGQRRPELAACPKNPRHRP